MKYKIGFIISLVAISVFLLAMIGKEHNPEKGFVGAWTETNWTFIQAEQSVVTNLGLLSIPEEQDKDSVRVHTAKHWKFAPDGQLILQEKNETKTLSWKLKGRGHILEVSDGNVTEFYDVKHLSKNKMVLNFVAPSYVKESAKLVIERS